MRAVISVAAIGVAALISIQTVSGFAQNSADNVIPDDPIGFIGHGAIFDKAGKQIQPDLDFIEKTQDHYISVLRERLDDAERQAFDEGRAAIVQDQAIDRQSGMVAKTRMLEWLLKQTGDAKDGSVGGKIRLLGQLLEFKDPPSRGEKIAPQPDLMQKLDAAGFTNIALFSTDKFGEQYIAECAANGVPTPPDIGSSQWQKSVPGGSSVLTGSQLFIVSGISAEVHVHKSATPEGMCIALPRSASPGTTGNIIELDGVICVGKASGKTCFWDNQAADGPGGPGPAFPFTEGDVIPISQFAGGADLFGGTGGICTGCHTGENPYIIHPKTPLGKPALNALPIFPDQWYQPMVHADWPQNVGPIDQGLVVDSCGVCHDEGAPGGRFPQFDATLPGGYCNTILDQAITRTMPPASPGSLSGDAAVQAFQNLCNQ